MASPTSGCCPCANTSDPVVVPECSPGFSTLGIDQSLDTCSVDTTLMSVFYWLAIVMCFTDLPAGIYLIIKNSRSATTKFHISTALSEPKWRFVLFLSFKVVHHLLMAPFVILNMYGHRFYTIKGMMVLHFFSAFLFWIGASIYTMHFISTYEQANLKLDGKTMADRLKTSLATVLLHFFLLMVAGIVTSFSDDNAIIYVKFYALSTVYFVTAFLLISTYVSFKIRGVVRKHLMDQQRGEKAVYMLYLFMGVPILTAIVAIPVLIVLFVRVYPIYMFFSLVLAQTSLFIFGNLVGVISKKAKKGYRSGKHKTDSTNSNDNNVAPSVSLKIRSAAVSASREASPLSSSSNREKTTVVPDETVDETLDEIVDDAEPITSTSGSAKSQSSSSSS